MKAQGLGYPFLMSIFLGKNFLKSAAMAVAFICSAGLLTSCGASKEEKALKANCEKIFSYLKSVEDTPEIFENSSVADSDSVALLLGVETRERVEMKILALFPYLDEIIVGRAKDKQQIDSYYYSGSIYLIEKSLEETDIDFPYSQGEMLTIATTEDDWEDMVYPLAHKIFGDYFELKNHQGCAVVDAEKENPNPDNNTSVAFERASNVYIDFASSLQAIRDCKVSGWHVGNQCSKNDYVSEPSTYTPSNEPTAEELEILAERERQAQKGDQGSSGSSGNSNVSAGQVCNGLGKVVNTANYGELTCKLVLVGRLRTLVWMRS